MSEKDLPGGYCVANRKEIWFDDATEQQVNNLLNLTRSDGSKLIKIAEDAEVEAREDGHCVVRNHGLPEGIFLDRTLTTLAELGLQDNRGHNHNHD